MLIKTLKLPQESFWWMRNQNVQYFCSFLIENWEPWVPTIADNVRTAGAKGVYIYSHKSIKIFLCNEMCRHDQRSGNKNQKPMLLLRFSGKRCCHGHKLISLQTNVEKKKVCSFTWNCFRRTLLPCVFFLRNKAQPVLYIKLQHERIIPAPTFTSVLSSNFQACVN